MQVSCKAQETLRKKKKKKKRLKDDATCPTNRKPKREAKRHINYRRDSNENNDDIDAKLTPKDCFKPKGIFMVQRASSLENNDDRV